MTVTSVSEQLRVDVTSSDSDAVPSCNKPFSLEWSTKTITSAYFDNNAEDYTHEGVINIGDKNEQKNQKKTNFQNETLETSGRNTSGTDTTCTALVCFCLFFQKCIIMSAGLFTATDC